MSEKPFEGWAVLELMGHRRLAGWVSEQEIAGAAFLRLDVPEHPWVDGCTCGSENPRSISHEDHAHVCAMFRAPGEEQPLDVTATQFYSAAALYCLTPTTEEVARGMAQSLRPQPVQRWELPAPALKSGGATVPVTHPDDECDCGHPRSAHEDIVDGECDVSDCDCPNFTPPIPF